MIYILSSKQFYLDIFQITEKNNKLKATIFWPVFDILIGVSLIGMAGNALERVQRVHEPADLQDITFWTRRILSEPAEFLTDLVAIQPSNFCSSSPK